MRTVITQSDLAEIINDYVSRQGADYEYIMFTHFDDGTIGAVVTHGYEFEVKRSNKTKGDAN